MEHLTFNDTQSLLQGIQKLYTFCNLETFAVDALTILDQLVSSNILTFHATKVRTRQISHTFLPNCPGFTPEIERAIHRHFDEHPLLQHMPQTLHGAYQTSDFVSQKELHCCEGFYQKFLRPLDSEEQMTIFLPNTNLGSWRELTQTDTTLVGFSLHRAQRFTERDRLILNLLRPHLSQAYDNAQHYQRLQRDISKLQQSLNHLDLVILNPMGQVQWISPQAALWLETYFSKSNGILQFPDHLWAWVKHQVTQDPDRQTTLLPLRIQQDRKQLVIRLVVDPIGEQYLLLLEEQTIFLSESLDLLGLSQRETKVLFWMMKGKDNKAIAVQLSIGYSTVGKHLESIYRKLGVQSRTEAIAQALEKFGLF